MSNAACVEYEQMLLDCICICIMLQSGHDLTQDVDVADVDVAAYIKPPCHFINVTKYTNAHVHLRGKASCSVL